MELGCKLLSAALAFTVTPPNDISTSQSNDMLFQESQYPTRCAQNSIIRKMFKKSGICTKDNFGGWWLEGCCWAFCEALEKIPVIFPKYTLIQNSSLSPKIRFYGGYWDSWKCMSLLCDVEFSFGVVTVNAKTVKKSYKNYAFGSVCKVLSGRSWRW